MGRLLSCLAFADYAAADGNNRGCKIGSADHAVVAVIPGRAFCTPSSPANAGDPVNADISILINVAEYWMPRLRGA
jgi:hypothetical protein